MNESQLVKFGQYLLSQERKRRFKSAPRSKKEEGSTEISLSLRERLASVHHADIENFKADYEANPEIEYTQSKQVILK